MEGITPIKTRAGVSVGYVLNDVYCKTIDSKRGHILRKPPAIGFDMSTLRDAQMAGARLAQITDSATGQVRWATMEMIFMKGFPQARGAGTQQFLPLHRWNATRDGALLDTADVMAERAYHDR